MARRIALGAGLLGLIVSLALVAPAWKVAAEGPSSAGWWTSENPGAAVSPSELPVATPAGGGPAGMPSDIPPNGLEVASDAQGVVSYAALGYYIGGSGETGDSGGSVASSVTLQLAPNAVDLPNSQVVACPLKGAGLFTVAHGGPISQGPSYDCSNFVAGVMDPANGSVSFEVGKYVVNGYLGVAIVGTGSTRLVFSAPGTSTVKIRGNTAGADRGATPAESSPSLSPKFVAPAPAVALGGSDQQIAAPASADGPAPAALPAPAATAAPPAASDTAVVAAQQARSVAVNVPSVSIKPGGAVIGAFLVLLLAVGVAVRNRVAVPIDSSGGSGD